MFRNCSKKSSRQIIVSSGGTHPARCYGAGGLAVAAGCVTSVPPKSFSRRLNSGESMMIVPPAARSRSTASGSSTNGSAAGSDTRVPSCPSMRKTGRRSRRSPRMVCARPALPRGPCWPRRRRSCEPCASCSTAPPCPARPATVPRARPTDIRSDNSVPFTSPNALFNLHRVLAPQRLKNDRRDNYPGTGGRYGSLPMSPVRTR